MTGIDAWDDRDGRDDADGRELEAGGRTTP